MKLLRRLKSLELTLPVRRGKNADGEQVVTLLPMTPVLTFLKRCNDIEDGTLGEHAKINRLKYYLIEQHQSIFGTPPSMEVPLKVVKSRCAYRLQSEGFRVAGQEPSDRFKQNYQAVMRFDDLDPFKGCDPETAWISQRLTMEEKGKVITMAAVKKVVKEQQTPATAETKKAVQSRDLVLGKYPPTAVIRYYASTGAAVAQIALAMVALGANVAAGTINVQSGKGKKGENIPAITTDEEKALKDALPDASGVSKPVKAMKPREEKQSLQSAPKPTKPLIAPVPEKPLGSVPKKLVTEIQEVPKKVLKKLPKKVEVE